MRTEISTGRILAVDPGNTTGWAIYEKKSPASIGEVSVPDFKSWLREIHGKYGPVAVVVEDYIIRPEQMKGFAHSWDKGQTLRLIGMIEYWADCIGIPFFLQQPAEKVMGYKLANIDYKKGKKGMHMWDAIAHGKLFITKLENGKFPEYK